MNRYTILGLEPGDGGVSHGNDPVDAFANWISKTEGIDKEYVLSHIGSELEKKRDGYWVLGDYEIYAL